MFTEMSGRLFVVLAITAIAIAAGAANNAKNKNPQPTQTIVVPES